MQKEDVETKQSLAAIIAAMSGDNLSKAESLCRDFLVVNASSVPHIQLLSHALIRQQKYDEAREQIEFALKIAPDYARLYEDLGSLHGMQRQSAQKGLAALCIGGGQGVAMAVERVD